MLFTSLLAADGATWYPVRFDSTLNIARGIFFWITIAIALAFVVCAAVLKGETRGKFVKYGLYGVVGYACVVGITLLALTFCEDGITLILFLPLLILLIAILASAAALMLYPGKLTLIVSGCVSGAALVAVLVCVGINFANGDSLIANWIEDASSVNNVGLYVSAVLAVAAVIAAAFVIGKDDKKGFDTKTISYAAVCIAMSFALSYLRVVKMPQGGSITVGSLLPLMIFSYMFGVKKGVFAGFVYGLLQAFQDPTVLHPAQFLLDYPVAFACIGLAGAFAKVKALEKAPQLQLAFGGIVAGLARFLMHYLSGVFAFGEFAPEGQPVWLYSLIYQSAYVLPDIAIAIALGVFVFCSKSFVSVLRKFNNTERTDAAHADKESGN